MTPQAVAASLERVRAQAPLVHNVTNDVAMQFSANLLIAAGASPIMSMAEEETAELAAMSGALVVNMGTATSLWLRGAQKAIAGAQSAGRPWVFDPVGIGATGYRREIGARLFAAGPTVVRGNGSEIVALAGETGGGGRGVDSTLGSDAALDAAKALARRAGCTAVVTGEIDLITDGQRVLRLANGHPLLTRITASGCGLTALVGAWLAVCDDQLQACAGALAAYGVAAEIAAERTAGPGTFMAGLIDALAALEPAALEARVRLL